MSVFQKLQNVRVAIQSKSLKKSGKNSRFDYFELKDFLPSANEEFAKAGLCPVFTIRNNHSENGVIEEVATLTIYGDDNLITFEIPTAEVILAGSQNPIQCLGAKNTYLKRYLYMNALEISENDIVDAEEQEEPKATPKQVQMLESYYTDENLDKLLQANNLEKLEDISKAKASELIAKIMERGKRNG